METRTLDTVIYEKDGPVAWITLDYAEKANIQSSGLVFDVDPCLDDADRTTTSRWWCSRPTGRVSVPATWCSGSPGTEMREIDESTATLGSPWKGQWDIYGTPVLKLWDFPKVTIAQVHGYCLGGGTVWGLLTDMTVASEDAYFQFPVLQGMAMPTMETGIEPWLFMNWKRASEYMYTAQEIGAAEAKEMGLINRVVSAGAARGRGQRAGLPRGPGPPDHPDGGQGQHPPGLGPDGPPHPPPAVERSADRGHPGHRRPGVHPGRLPGGPPAAGRGPTQRRAGQGAGRRVQGPASTS